MSPHLSRHGSKRLGDALDLYSEQCRLIRSLLEEWDKTNPRDKGDRAVPAEWDHGTVGKLLLEHGAVFLAAKQHIAWVLRKRGEKDLSDELSFRQPDIRGVLNRMYECSRGVPPIPLSKDPEFVEATRDLIDLLRPEVDEDVATALVERIMEALGAGRASLRSATFITKHAPAHSRAPRWYSRVPVLARLHTAYDRLRGFPWGDSPVADRKLAKRYAPEQ